MLLDSAGATIRRIGRSPRAQDKGGRKDDQVGERNVPKINKEGCKTDLRGVQI